MLQFYKRFIRQVVTCNMFILYLNLRLSVYLILVFLLISVASPCNPIMFTRSDRNLQPPSRRRQKVVGLFQILKKSQSKYRNALYLSKRPIKRIPSIVNVQTRNSGRTFVAAITMIQGVYLQDCSFINTIRAGLYPLAGLDRHFTHIRCCSSRRQTTSTVYSVAMVVSTEPLNIGGLAGT